MSYKLELHAHSKEISLCASADTELLTELYTKAGYDGVVLCNHFDPYTIPHLPADEWCKKVDIYVSAYEKFKNIAKGKLDVIFGVELRMKDTFNDYLLFGVDKSFLYNNPDVFDYGIKKLSAVCREQGILLFQAHPFRNGMTIVNPSYLDGVEVFNGHRGHDSRNEIALAWAEKYKLLKSSGSDFHDPHSAIDAGIITQDRITSQAELKEALLSGSYEMICKSPADS